MSITVNTGGGGGPATLADGADATQGAVGDSPWNGSGSGTVVGILKSVRALLNTLAASVSSNRVNTNIQRTGASTSVTIGSGATDSGAIDISSTIAGGFIIPGTFSGTSMTYKVSHTTSGHQPLYDQYGTQVKTDPISTNRAYPFPAEAAGYASLILVSGTSEGAIRTIQVYRKG